MEQVRRQAIKQFKFIVLFLALVTASVIVGCSSPGISQPGKVEPRPLVTSTTPAFSATEEGLTSSSMTPVEILTATSPLGDGLGATSTYRNQEIGFELDYPAEWYIEDVSAEIREQSSVYAVVLTSWEPGLGGVGGIPAGATKVGVIVIKSGTTTLQEAVAQLRQQWEAGDPPVTILSEEKWALAGDLQAVRWQVESLGEQSAAVITVINGNTVILSGLGDSDLFDAVARTMRPL